MEIKDSDIFVVGYGGWVLLKREHSGENYQNHQSSVPSLSGTLLQVTSASVTRTTQVPTLNSYYLPFLESDTAKSPIRVGPNLYTFSGELSFEVTDGVLDELFHSDFFSRSSWFWVEFFDGQNTVVMSNCVWSSVSITCGANSIVTMSMSFQSNNGYHNNLNVVKANVNPSISYKESDLLVPYWTCGHEGFSEFSMTFNRNVTPIFLNNDLQVPSYLRPGLIDVSLQATTIEYVENWNDNLNIHVGSQHGIRLITSNLMSKQYNMSSMTDTGPKTYTWNSIAMNAEDSIFTIY